MKARAPTNLHASIHQRLLNQAKVEGRPLQELLHYFAIERFLFRLGQSRYASRFLLKGALMLRLWGTPMARPTLDIDLMGQMKVSEESIAKAIQEIVSVKVSDDGVRFESTPIRTEVIRLDADYQGVRARFVAHIGNMRIPMQVDVGSGDAVVPGPVEIEFPVLLDFPAPSLLAYPPESAVAEKYQAIVSLWIWPTAG